MKIFILGTILFIFSNLIVYSDEITVCISIFGTGLRMQPECDIHIDFRDVNNIDDLKKKMSEYASKNVILPESKNDKKKLEEIGVDNSQKIINYIFNNCVFFSMDIYRQVHKSHGHKSHGHEKYFKINFKKAFEELKKDDINWVCMNFCEKKKFEVICDYDELIDEEEIKRIILKGIEKKHVKNDLREKIKKCANMNFIELIKNEIEQIKNFFNSENSFFLLDYYNEGTASNPINRLQDYIEAGFIHDIIFDYCYRFNLKDDKLKVVFCDEILKNADYKVVIKDKNGNILNDKTTTFNYLEYVRDNKEYFEKHNICFSPEFIEKMMFKGKNEDDTCYCVPESCNCVDRLNRKITYEIDEKKDTFCNFSIKNNSGHGPKNYTFFTTEIDEFLTKIGIDTKNFNISLKDKNGNIKLANKENLKGLTGEYEFTVAEKKNTEKKKDIDKPKIPSCCCKCSSCKL